jgi:hypothetical protein
MASASTQEKIDEPTRPRLFLRCALIFRPIEVAADSQTWAKHLRQTCTYIGAPEMPRSHHHAGVIPHAVTVAVICCCIAG